jgi:hypothetical protein
MKWYEKLIARLRAWLEKHSAQMPIPEPPAPDPEVQPPLIVGTQIAISWHDNAAYRQMNDSAEHPDTALRRMRASRASGCNTVNWYLFNYRDGRPVPSTIYAGAWGAQVDTERVARYRSLAEDARRESMGVNWWFLADDGGIPYKDAKAIKRAIVDVCNRLGDVILAGGGYVVIALESDETLTKDLMQEYAREFKRMLPGVKIANHMTSSRFDWSKDSPEVDCHFHQTNPKASVADFTREIKGVVKSVGKPVMACEFSLIGVDETAKQKARIALDAGCIGVHSGVPK